MADIGPFSVGQLCLCCSKWYGGIMGNKNSSASEMGAEEEILSLVLSRIKVETPVDAPGNILPKASTVTRHIT